MEQPSISSDLIRGHIDTIILKSLKDGDKHVQQIIDYVESKSNGNYSLNQATLYSSLKRLESNEHLSSYWHNADDGRRKFFKITSKGLDSMSENLSNWEYSRSIIDKLMDATPTVYDNPLPQNENLFVNNEELENNDNEIRNEPSAENEIIFKTVNISSSVQQFSLFGTEQSKEKVSETSSDVKTDVLENKSVEDNFDEKPLSQPETSTNNVSTEVVFIENKPKENKVEKNVNFRQILNGLIESTTPIKKENEENTEEVLTPINKESPVEIAKFNKTISESNYTAQVSNNTTKIDFTDLSLIANKDGYKLRISAKDSAKPKGFIYSNKLRFYSALIVMIICAVEAIILSSTVSGLSDTTFILLTCLVVLCYPIVSAVFYIKNPRKTTSKKDFLYGITTSAIVIFNAIIIVTALNIVLEADFKNTLSISRSFVIPIMLFIDVFLYFVIKFILSKTSVAITKIKKA